METQPLQKWKILMQTLTAKLKEARQKTDDAFLNALQHHILKDNEIDKAACYSFVGGGKALRPFLVLTIADLLNLSEDQAVQIALAIEMVHTYSLIHDDLPSMDNDTLRRGKATCHIQFSESTAILTGDALLTKAFEILANEITHPDANIRCKLISLLAQSAGINGMIGGQLIDLDGEKRTLTEHEIYQMQSLKTGALLRFSCLAPAIAANADKAVLKALDDYAKTIGILFQITDDLLDESGDEKTVGKTLKKDKKAHKSTFVTIYGKEKALYIAKQMHQNALESLSDPLFNKNSLLKELADFILTRNH